MTEFESKEFSIIIAFFILMLFILIKYAKREKSFNVGTLILGVFTFSSFISIFYYLQPLYSPTYGITIEPYIFWVVVFLFAMFPIFCYDHQYKENINIDYGLIHGICRFGLVVSLLPLYEQALHISDMLSSSNELYSVIQDAHEDIESTKLSWLGWRCNLLVSSIYMFVVFSFILLLDEIKKDYVSIAGAIVVIITYNFSDIIAGSRNGIITLILNFVLCFFILKPFISSDSRKIFVKYSLIGGLFVMLLFAVITIARQSIFQEREEDYTMLYFLLRYVGEGFLHFNDYTPHLIGYADGDYCFYLPKLLLGMDPTGLSRDYMTGYLSSHTGIPILIFYTFIGFFVIDIGYFWTAVYWCLNSIFFSCFFKTKSYDINMSTLFVFFAYASMIINGVCLYYYSTGHAWRMVPIILFYIILKQRER